MNLRSLVLAGAAALTLGACLAEIDDAPALDAAGYDVGDDATPGRDAGVGADAGTDTSADAVADADVDTSDIAAFYLAECAGCHGAAGEGGVGPLLAGTSRTVPDLADIIDRTMPSGDPSRCVGDCADDMARFIATMPAIDDDAPCEEVAAPAPRGLRLLTRRQLDRTLVDLFDPGGDGVGATCTSDAQCELRTEQCDVGVCRANPCGTTTFVFDDGDRTPRSVHVAGAFNDWPGTLAAGGWPLTYDAGRDLWIGRYETGAARWEYKFVIDETDWVTDEVNPDRTPDGFGGFNSVVDVSCDATSGSRFERTWSDALPPEVRPEGFVFDTHGASGFATATHVDAWLDIAEDVVALALDDIDGLVGCDWRGAPAACADTFVRDFGLRAFRRPLTDAEVGRYVARITGASDFAAGLEEALQVMLLSPSFLYRSELGEPAGDGTYRLTPYEIASWLSYTYQGTMPDDALLRAAADGTLSTRAGIEAQARRLLADPRAREPVAAFAEQWLGIEGVLNAVRAQSLYPGFGDALRTAMRAETRQLVTHVVFDGSGSFHELFTADYTFANDVLADVYGMPGVTGSELRRVAYPDDRRSGLLGHGSVLVATAHSDQTSPIRRGLFVRRALLCQEFGQPPANAGGVPEVDPDATTRERFAQHTDNEFCASCHVYIDDLGFGFEHFDAIGAWRDTEAGAPIDARGNLNDAEGFGTETDAFYASLPELANHLIATDSARTCFVRQYYRYSRGYLDGRADRCALESIDDAFVGADLDIREMMVAVTREPFFDVRR